MITFTLVTAGALLLSGVSVLTGAEWGAEVKAARRWLARRLMPCAGRHAVPPGEVAASARRTPSRVENEAAAGGAPGFAGPGAGRRSSTERVCAGGRLPGDLPRRHVWPGRPPWLTAPMPAVTGAPGGRTGTTRPLGLAGLGPADAAGRTLAERVSTP